MPRCKVCGAVLPKGEVLCSVCIEKVKQCNSEVPESLLFVSKDGVFRHTQKNEYRKIGIPIKVPTPPNTSSNVQLVDTSDMRMELSDEYMYNHLQEAMYYALKEKGFVKSDSGKLQWSLLPFEELKDVVRVLMLGAKKYSPDNWKKCDDVTRYKDALMRHVISYVSGDTTDDESGLSHLAHAVCNCLFLMYFDNTKKEK